MELYQELLLTAVISILLAFLIGKLAASTASDGDDLDRAPAESRLERAAVGVAGVSASASASVEDKQVRFHEGGGLVEEVEAIGERRGQSVDDGRPAAEPLGSGRIESNEVVGEDGPDEEKLSEGGLARSDEARAGEPDVEKKNGGEKRSEVNDAGLEVDSAEESREMVEIKEIDAELVGDGIGVERRDGKLVLEEERGGEIGRERESGIDERAGSLLHGEDEWEGIERSELEKHFGVAMAYVGNASGGDAVSRLSSDMQMELYGLHKIATEGPCYEQQPLALKVSARAKWHAWQRLGNMNPEVAMEQYITLLSHSIPGWMGERSGGDTKRDEGNDPPEEGVLGIGTPDPESSLHSQLSSNIEREPENPTCIEGDNASAGPKHSDQGLAKAFFLNLISPTTVRFLSFYW